METIGGGQAEQTPPLCCCHSNALANTGRRPNYGISSKTRHSLASTFMAWAVTLPVTMAAVTMGRATPAAGRISWRV